MARENNFLLGYGERLTRNVSIPSGGGNKNPPYEHEAAVLRISTRLSIANDYYNILPEDACPRDEVTAVITMHPRYISKSDFPTQLFQQVGLRAVGGRAKLVLPEKWGINQHPKEAVSDEIFVVGKRSAYTKWAKEIKDWLPEHTLSKYLPTIEDLRPFTEEDKVPKSMPKGKKVLLEVVLHNNKNERVLNTFKSYITQYEGIIVADRIREVHSLLFVPVYANADKVNNIAKFSLIRVIREMPSLRSMAPFLRGKTTSKIKLPISLPAFDENIRVAIFDGGISDNINLPWVRKISPNGIGPSVPSAEDHGLDVTSSLLFGPIDTDKDVAIPLCNVDHIRVIDQSTGSKGDFMYYDVLDRILDSIDNTKTPYEFINLSLGPDIPADDNDITRWTAELDQRLSGGMILATIAAGNNGDADAVCMLNRIQPPSDGVNVLAVGACDRDDYNWKRASYSCVGPGRCPGFVKPDGMAFGGSDRNRFLTVSSNVSNDIYYVSDTMGTSFAAPYALRSAVSIKAQLGDYFNTLSIRALMIHRADKSEFDQREVGWGKFEVDSTRLITCDDDEALVIFQGSLPVKEHLRVPVPIPTDGLNGMVSITATLVISPEVDASFPNTYTRAGLTVNFRPDHKKFKPEKDGKVPKHAETKSFFNLSNIFNNYEYALRSDGHKWETCLKAMKKFQAKALDQPCFDVYYNNRFEGCADNEAKPIPYAFIVSVKAPKVLDLYNRTVRTYMNQLVALRPKTRIQLNVK